jgi:hypothetical protein
MKQYSRFLEFAVPLGISALICAVPVQADTLEGGGINLLPVYKVEAVEFHCNDEVGYDSPWFAPWISDEVRVGISASDATTISKVFNDVDSGETWGFPTDQSCISPIDGQSPGGDRVFAPGETWTCSQAGRANSIVFTVVMAEEDSGFFHNCLSDFPSCHSFFSPDRVPSGDDDLIGRRTVEITRQELAAAMPNVGDTYEETITLGPCFDEQGNEGGCVIAPGLPTDAEYTFTYRITRLPLSPAVF